MTKHFKNHQKLNLRRGELIEIDAGAYGRFAGYVSHATQNSIDLQPSMPGRETGTDYDNGFTFWYDNFKTSTIKITRLIDSPMGLEKTMLVDVKK